jgi:hypothetical protein
MITPKSTNWVSNLYVGLPSKTNVKFTAAASYRDPTDANGEYRQYSLFGVAKAGDSVITVIPTSNAAGANVLMYSLVPPYDVSISGSYEYQA